jgi:hypothetical protein
MLTEAFSVEESPNLVSITLRTTTGTPIEVHPALSQNLQVMA